MMTDINKGIDTKLNDKKVALSTFFEYKKILIKILIAK